MDDEPDLAPDATADRADPTPNAPQDPAPARAADGSGAKSVELPVLAVLSGGLIVAALMTVARGDVDTALEILRSSGTSIVLVGVLFMATPYIFMLASFVLAVSRLSGGGWLESVPGWAWVVILAPLAYVTPVWLVVVWAMAMILFHSIASRGTTSGDGVSSFLTLIVLTVLSLAGPFLTFDRMWLPSEQIEAKDAESFVGYVLSSDDTELRVLRDGDRKVITLPVAEVESRTSCSLHETQWRTFALASWRDNTPSYPECIDEAE